MELLLSNPTPPPLPLFDHQHPHHQQQPEPTVLDIEDGWDVVDWTPTPEEEESNNSASASSASKMVVGNGNQGELGFFEATKSLWYSSKLSLMSSLYNYYQRVPTIPATFSASPCWLLGKSYELTLTERKKQQNFNDQQQQFPHAQRLILDVYHSLLWFTYRRDFPVIPCYDNLTSDIGWGCMLRTGQMLLARVLLNLPLYVHEWALSEEDQQNPFSSYRQILRMFADTPMAPFSIHTLVEENNLLHGAKKDLSSGGEWFSPTKLSLTLEQLLQDTLTDELEIYVPSDGTIYVHDVLRMCVGEKKKSPRDSPPHGTSPAPSNRRVLSPVTTTTTTITPPVELPEFDVWSKLAGLTSFYTATSKPREEESGVHKKQEKKKKTKTSDLFLPETWDGLSSEIAAFLRNPDWPCMEWRPILFLIPSRIGIEKINLEYVHHIKLLFESKHSVGIVGGKPRASYYFVGYQDDEIIYLDPHLAQDSIPADITYTPQLLQSYHCKAPQKMPFSQIDPSFTVGIFCKTLKDFLQFTHDQMLFMASEKHLSVFTISEYCPEYIESCYQRKMRRRKTVNREKEKVVDRKK